MLAKEITNGFLCKNFDERTGISSKIFLIHEEIVNIFPWLLFACNLGNMYQTDFPELMKGLI
jgi:hypothetical protein